METLKQQKLKAEIEQKLRQYFEAEPEYEERILTDWVILSAHYLDPNTTSYQDIIRDGQPFHTTLGLVTQKSHRLQAALMEDDDD